MSVHTHAAEQAAGGDRGARMRGVHHQGTIVSAAFAVGDELVEVAYGREDDRRANIARLLADRRSSATEPTEA